MMTIVKVFYPRPLSVLVFEVVALAIYIMTAVCVSLSIDKHHLSHGLTSQIGKDIIFSTKIRAIHMAVSKCGKPYESVGFFAYESIRKKCDQ